MEACAIGRPIITTAIPGCQETVESGVNGYLVPPKNTKALVKAIFQFIELPLDAKREIIHGKRTALGTIKGGNIGLK